MIFLAPFALRVGVRVFDHLTEALWMNWLLQNRTAPVEGEGRVRSLWALLLAGACLAAIPGVSQAQEIVTAPGPGPGLGAHVRGFDGTGAPTGTSFLAYPTPVDFGANVVFCDVDGDGVMDIITGPGPGPSWGAHVKGFRLDGTPIPGLSFLAHPSGVFYGVNVACGDLNGDGRAEIITGPGPGPGNGAHVRAFSYDSTSQQVRDTGVSFLAYPDGVFFGVNVAAADLDADGKAEIITGPGPGEGNGAHVRAFQVNTAGGLGNWRVTPLPVSFLAYPDGVFFGVNVAAGDLDADGRAEILTGPGPGPGNGAHVRAFRYAPTAPGGVSDAGVSFLAYPPGVFYGANVAAGDLDGDGRAEIITGPGPGPGQGAHVRAFRYAPTAPGGVSDTGVSFLAYPTPVDFGVRVGARSLLSPASSSFLTAADVAEIVRKAAESLDATTMVIAVTDRLGNILAVFRKPNAPSTFPGNFGVPIDTNDLAISLARTGAFFSNNQAPLSSRTVRFISGIHFPPGISNKPNGALYGIENTNRGCSLNTTFIPGKEITLAGSLNRLPCNSTDQRGCGPGITTGKADLFDTNPNAVNGGGVPIFKDGGVVGGIGVTGVSPEAAEFAAFVGSVPDARFGPRPADPGVIFLDGIQLPFVNQTTRPGGTGSGQFSGAFVLGPLNSPLGPAGVPDGWLIGPLGSPELSAAEVGQIVSQAVALANQVRAAIRLPLGSTTRMMIGVTDLQGNILGLFRMPDSTIFSIDVAVAKARNVVFFSGPSRSPGDLPGVPIGTAVTNRTISFGAQPLYPPGIDGTAPGPFFQLYLNDVAAACSQGSQPPTINQSGIVFFPGSVPLYKNGQLVGGVGVSGDGVEQDDLVAAAGATGFAPPLEIRADQVFVGGIRLPFLKFPRNPLVQ